ncbi:MAG: DUF1592 domain-containing protein, partial [Verrucomicrobiota bacterium]
MTYCYDCHGDGMEKGEVALDHHETEAERLADRELWEGVYANIDSMLMPPVKKDQPTDEERAAMLAWIEDEVFKLDPKNPDPGKPVVRRMNRDEYNRSVSELFGTKLQPAKDFPEDDTGYGFDNIGAVLSLSPTLMSKYVSASGDVMSQVVRRDQPKTRTYHPGKEFVSRKGQPDTNSGVMASTGVIGVRFQPEKEGQYEIKVIARGSQAKNMWPMMRVSVEKSASKDIEVDSLGAKSFTLRARMSGSHQRWIDIGFLNDLYDPKAKDRQQRDRNLMVNRIEIRGPLTDSPAKPTADYQRILNLGGADGSEPDKARRIIKSITERAWRRPPTEEQLSRIFQIFDRAREDGAVFDDALALSLQAVIISPRFLFRGEIESVDGKPGDVIQIDEYSLATRLSYFLWSSLPDAELRGHAAAGTLRQNLRQEIERMLLDPKASALTENFAGQWLQLRNLNLVDPDPKLFSQWSAELKSAMQQETELYFAAIVSENRSVMEFIDSDYSYLNRQLADFYGVPGKFEDGKFQRVTFQNTDRQRRGGVMTQASILTITSNPTRTSAVNRGNYVLENILGTPAPPPPEELEIPE